MRAIAELVQRNPSLLLVLLVGLPSLTWAAAYARRPSRARRRVALVPFVLMWLVALVAVAEALRGGLPWWPAVALAAAISVPWAVAFFRKR
jgi:hypothetical protein